MANNYCDMTGVLILDKVTPVIKALFGVFKLDESFPGNGEAFIAHTSEGNCCWWTLVLENLQELADGLGLELVDDGTPAESVEGILRVLAKHFNADQNAGLAHLVDHHLFEGDADLDALTTIALAFDDGHGLKAYKTEASWRCSKLRLFEFGGTGCFAGTHVAVTGSSDQFVQFGEALEVALAAGNTDAAAERVFANVGSLLAGIHDEGARAEVRSKLIALLSAAKSV